MFLWNRGRNTFGEYHNIPDHDEISIKSRLWNGSKCFFKEGWGVCVWGGESGGGAPGCGRDGRLTGTNITGNNDLVRNIFLNFKWKCRFKGSLKMFLWNGGRYTEEDITIYLKMIRSGLFQ